MSAFAGPWFRDTCDSCRPGWPKHLRFVSFFKHSTPGVKGNKHRANPLLQGLQQALQMSGFLVAQGHKWHNQHGSSASGDQPAHH